MWTTESPFLIASVHRPLPSIQIISISHLNISMKNDSPCVKDKSSQTHVKYLVLLKRRGEEQDECGEGADTGNWEEETAIFDRGCGNEIGGADGGLHD